jgi:hypothetical protein
VSESESSGNLGISYVAMSSTPFYASVADFVAQNGGDHAIEKVLVANNGLGATKAIRSIRKWAFETFGNERIVSIHDNPA